MTRLCVAGVGAVGGLLAARLAQAGHTVCLIARGARLHDLREAGVHVAGSPPIRLESSDAPVFGVQDFIFLSAKAQALPTLLPKLSPMIGPQTCVVPVVNGIPWWYFKGLAGTPERPVAAVDPTGHRQPDFWAHIQIAWLWPHCQHRFACGTKWRLGHRRALCRIQGRNYDINKGV